MQELTGILPDATIINSLAHSRRSTFIPQFDTGKPVPDEIIVQALENANWAPTHKLTEPWRFTVFTGDGLKKFAEQQAAIYKEFAGSKFKQPKYESMLVQPMQCSHVIAIGCKRHVGEIPEMEEVAAVACAVENIWLTLTAYGIGGYWSTGGITFMEEAKPLFNLGPDDILMGFFYVGNIGVPSTPGKRKPVGEKVEWVRG